MTDKEQKAGEAIKLAASMSKEYYGRPLIITYSGGKDSDVMLSIAESVLKPSEFEVLNSHTTVDAPQTVWHIRDVFKRLNDKGVKTTIKMPHYKDGTPMTMWNLIVNKGLPPTRLVRYCCQELKETGTPNRICCVGVRADESTKRQGRDTFTMKGRAYKDAHYFSLDHAAEVFQESKEINDPNWDCTLIKRMKEHGNIVVNPIYEFTEQDVWEYIGLNHIGVNTLYESPYNFSRVGCVGCPLAAYRQKQKEFYFFPTYKQAYINAFQKMLDKRKSEGKIDDNEKWKDGQAVFDWWVEEYKHNCKGQMELKLR